MTTPEYDKDMKTLSLESTISLWHKDGNVLYSACGGKVYKDGKLWDTNGEAVNLTITYGEEAEGDLQFIKE